MKNHRRVVAALVLSAVAASAQTKKRMMVEDFDYSAVLTAVQAIWGTQQNIGAGINAMMTKRIASDGRFIVVERRKIGSLTKEQDFAASNRVKRGTGARIGEIRGADLTLMGDIVVFGRDDRRQSAGVGGFGGGVGAVIGGSKSEGKAVVVLNYRLVDTETSEVVSTGEARGESKRTSKGFGAALLVGGVGVGGGASVTSSNFGETIIGEATMDAVNQLAQQLNTGKVEGGAADRTDDLDARVADVSGDTITINAGSGAGLQAGQKFTIYHKGKEIKDPTTGEVLDVQTTPLGTLTITTVRERISMGTFSGSGKPVAGDVVRK
jgi:curli biogenesis system outer membrane secretion channel CsgG